MGKYRYDNAYKKLYEYDEASDCYVWVSNNPYNLDEDALIEEYEEALQEN